MTLILIEIAPIHAVFLSVMRKTIFFRSRQKNNIKINLLLISKFLIVGTTKSYIYIYCFY